MGPDAVGSAAPPRPFTGGWAPLVVLSVAQLVVVLDDTVLNVALPSAQADLGFASGDRQWVVTAYAAAFAAVLPLGGRLVDRLGSRRVLVVGTALFAAASLVGGAAPSLLVLVVARVAQGVGAGMLAPAALAGLSATYPGGDRRRRAFGVFSSVSAAGAVLGLLLGGALTHLSWRWSLLINPLVAVPVLIGTRLLPAVPPRPREGDVVSVCCALGGLLLLVAGLSRLGDGLLPLVLLGAGLVLVGVFGRRQRTSADPVLPLGALRGERGVMLLALLLGYSGMFAVFVFLTFVLQRDMGLSPLLTGVAYLPMTAAIGVGSAVSASLVHRAGARALIPPGMLLAAAGLGWLTALDPGRSYATGVLGPTVVLGAGLGLVVATAVNLATAGPAEGTGGAAAALVNIAQQVGVALGTAALSGIAAAHAGTGPLAGPRAAFAGGSVVFVAGAALTLVLLTATARTAGGSAQRGWEADPPGTGAPADLRAAPAAPAAPPPSP